jgi:hypothetical protein
MADIKLTDSAEAKRELRNKKTYELFKKLVNMSASQIEKFLETDESKKVGFKKEGSDESVGHQSGRRIIKILRTPKSQLDESDYAHMRKVCAYITRHLAQGGPETKKETSRWRYSLMNWGHDPLRK